MATTLHDPRYRALVGLLVDARRAASLTQEELGSRLGRPQSFLGKVETYQRRLDALELFDLIAALDLDFRDFATRASAVVGARPARRRRRSS